MNLTIKVEGHLIDIVLQHVLVRIHTYHVIYDSHCASLCHTLQFSAVKML